MTAPERIWINFMKANHMYVAYDEPPLNEHSDCREAYILKSASDAQIEAAVAAERERAKVMVWTLGHEIRAAMLVDDDKEDAVMEMVKATAAAIRARGENGA